MLVYLDNAQSIGLDSMAGQRGVFLMGGNINSGKVFGQ
jgi:uncharacterized protein (DUF1800 family)